MTQPQPQRAQTLVRWGPCHPDAAAMPYVIDDASFEQLKKLLAVQGFHLQGHHVSDSASSASPAAAETEEKGKEEAAPAAAVTDEDAQAAGVKDEAAPASAVSAAFPDSSASPAATDEGCEGMSADSAAARDEGGEGMSAAATDEGMWASAAARDARCQMPGSSASPDSSALPGVLALETRLMEDDVWLIMARMGVHLSNGRCASQAAAKQASVAKKETRNTCNTGKTTCKRAKRHVAIPFPDS